MKPPQIAILGAAVVAAAAAAFLTIGRTAPPPPPPPIVELPQSTVEILVAARSISIGSKVTDADFKWQEWSQSQLPPGAILKSSSPNAPIEFAGLTIQSNVAASQPVLSDMLLKAGSYITRLLPPGKRAIAIPIDTQGLTTAGNFIQPNDKVDIIAREGGPEVGPGQLNGARTILRSIRVIAIGSAIPGQRSSMVNSDAPATASDAPATVSGVTATLEVTQQEAEILIDAVRMGSVALALLPVDEEPVENKPRKTFTIIRFGYPQVLPSK